MISIKIKILSVLFLLFHLLADSQSVSYDSSIKQRLLQIQKGLDSTLFVRRFEAIETPCLYIDSNNNRDAHAHRKFINTNYKLRFFSDDTIDAKGVQCLSKYYSNYARFYVRDCDIIDQSMTGKVTFTYGYPASSIIQYLGFTNNAGQKENFFYQKLLASSGTFLLYPENNKYKMKVWLNTGPYNKRDTFYAYLEIVKGINSVDNNIVYVLYFDQMSLYKGDPNNQIFLKFSSTSFKDECIYHTNLVFNSLKFLNSPNKDRKKAEAIWLKQFFENPKCPQCQFIYKQAEIMVKQHVLSLPNTEPSPPK